ncbi:hypothetical protein NQT62_07290 [Limnobacter humi]|uniref:Lipoprotein n=1 Tax=Limnobacter humi TaxID=1778671 RepID=A0ABT1WFE4_9BURK|nr:hypothetical protein [Limnobacter humi]MCQ8896237.1 hypothetical protein [Limnobacter humi]
MVFRNRQGILPQLYPMKAIGRPSRMPVLLCGAVLSLAACAGVQLQTPYPEPPATVDQAKAYMAARDQALANLDYEINQKTRECYSRFFVSDCLDKVRIEGAKLRRAHLEIQGQAGDLIRLDDYSKRRAGKN